MVFDCVGTFKGNSLKNHLLFGPNTVANFVDVLVRFRMGQVAAPADVKELRSSKIPRYLGDSKPQSQDSTELHVFSGASESAYGATVYLKRKSNETSTTNFIMVKYRIAPRKPGIHYPPIPPSCIYLFSLFIFTILYHLLITLLCLFLGY